MRLAYNTSYCGVLKIYLENTASLNAGRQENFVEYGTLFPLSLKEWRTPQKKENITKNSLCFSQFLLTENRMQRSLFIKP